MRWAKSTPVLRTLDQTLSRLDNSVPNWNGLHATVRWACPPATTITISQCARMNLTAAQRQAVAARGNVLVVASAGTGKTHALVERCLNCLLEERPPVSLDQILMVTFTEA